MERNSGESETAPESARAARRATASPAGRLQLVLSSRSRELAAWGAGIALALALLLMLRQERLRISLALGAVVALVVLALALGKKGKKLSTLAAIQIVLVFAYSWSLGQTVHFVIYATSTGVTANIGGVTRTVTFPKFPTAARHVKGKKKKHHGPTPTLSIGLYTGFDNESEVDPIGASDLNQVPQPVRAISSGLRFLTPETGWANLHLAYISPHGAVFRPVRKVNPVRGTWGTNVRGEITGSRGSIALLPRPRVNTFTLLGDLVRPDGAVGILIGYHLPQHGYILAIRMDERNAFWLPWKAPELHRWRQGPQPSRPFPLNDLTGEIQYFLRELLPSVILSLGIVILMLLLLPLSRLLVWAPLTVARRIPRPRWSVPHPSADATAILAGVAIAAGATGIMAWLSGYLYQRTPSTQDTVTDLFQARYYALGRLWVPIPQHLWFFSQYATLKINGHWLGKYPPGWALMLTVGVLFNNPWLVNPIVSGLGVLLVFLIGREMFGWKVALVAEILALSSPFILFLGAGFYAEPVAWLYIGLYVFFLLRWRRSALAAEAAHKKGRLGKLWLAAAGLAIGMAAVSRPLDALALGAPFLLLFIRRPFSIPKTLNVLWLAPGAAVPVCLYVAYSVIVTGSWMPDAHALANKWDVVGFGPNVGGAPGTFYNGYTPNVGFSNLATEMEYFHLGALGWPFLIAIAIASIPFVLGRARWFDWLVALAGLSMMTAYFFYWGTAIIQSSFPRYWYLLIPSLCLLVARGIQELYRLPFRFPRFRPDRFSPALAPAVLLASLLAYNGFVFSPALARDVHSWNDQDAAPLEAVARAHLHHAIVFQVEKVNNWWPWGCVFNANSPLMNGNIIWAKDAGGYDLQLMREYPSRAYYRLDNTILTRINPNTAARKFTPVPSSRGHQECGTPFIIRSTQKHKTKHHPGHTRRRGHGPAAHKP